jgi:GNAT superfamily N-acetyltransferase
MYDGVVVDVDALATQPLRRQVLRAGTPSTDVHLGEDDDPAAFHLGIQRDGALVACVSFSPQQMPARPDVEAWRFRAMAVDERYQGEGLGRIVLLAGFDRLRARAVPLVWAKARDTAIGFYERLGMVVVGDGFIDEATALAHHVMIREPV